jgi:hypothetical protein
MSQKLATPPFSDSDKKWLRFLMPYLTGTTQQDMAFYAKIIFVSITVAILVYKYVL